MFFVQSCALATCVSCCILWVYCKPLCLFCFPFLWLLEALFLGLFGLCSLFWDLLQVKLPVVYTSHLLFCYSSALGSQPWVSSLRKSTSSVSSVSSPAKNNIKVKETLTLTLTLKSLVYSLAVPASVSLQQDWTKKWTQQFPRNMSISRMCLVNPGPILFPLTGPMIAPLNCYLELALQEVDSSHCRLQRGQQWMITFVRHWRMDLFSLPLQRQGLFFCG